MLTSKLTPMMHLFGSRPSAARMLFSSQLYSAAPTTPQIKIAQANLDLSYLDQVLRLNSDEQEKVAYTMPFEFQDEDITLDLKGRNSKTPKKSNHGARPCSSVMRKLKKQGWFKKITSTK